VTRLTSKSLLRWLISAMRGPEAGTMQASRNPQDPVDFQDGSNLVQSVPSMAVCGRAPAGGREADARRDRCHLARGRPRGVEARRCGACGRHSRAGHHTASSGQGHRRSVFSDQGDERGKAGVQGACRLQASGLGGPHLAGSSGSDSGGQNAAATHDGFGVWLRRSARKLLLGGRQRPAHLLTFTAVKLCSARGISRCSKQFLHPVASGPESDGAYLTHHQELPLPRDTAAIHPFLAGCKLNKVTGNLKSGRPRLAETVRSSSRSS